jgi:hypothetical protein
MWTVVAVVAERESRPRLEEQLASLQAMLPIDTKEEDRVRVVFEVVERIYQRRIDDNRDGNVVLLGLIGVLGVFGGLFFDKSCDFGLLPAAGCFGVAIIALCAISGQRPDIEVAEFVSDMAEDPTKSLVARIEELRSRETDAIKSYSDKMRWIGVVTWGTLTILIYAFTLKAGIVAPLDLRTQKCAVIPVFDKGKSPAVVKTSLKVKR